MREKLLELSAAHPVLSKVILCLFCFVYLYEIGYGIGKFVFHVLH